MNILGTAGPGGDRAQGRMGSRPPNQAESKRPSRAYLASHWSNLPPPPAGRAAAGPGRGGGPKWRSDQNGGHAGAGRKKEPPRARAEPGPGAKKRAVKSKWWSNKVKQNSGQTNGVLESACASVCVCACVRVCVRMCVYVCVCACVRALR